MFDIRTSTTASVVVLGLGTFLGTFLGISGCEMGLPAGSEPHRELNFLDMADQPKVKPQRAGLQGKRPVSMMVPPEGSVAVNEEVYPYTQEQGDLAARLANPLPGDSNVVAHGEFIFENICITCHGPEAAGDGHLTKLFPKPPSLMTQKIRDWSDGRIYHRPMRGQGSMPSHSKQLESNDIWSVIHYIRSLQAKLPIAPPAEKEAPKEPDAASINEGGGQP